MSRCGGQFPDHFEGLQKLPGIGPYTAAAIASAAFREPVAAVDGNVYRVLARIFGIELETTSAKGKEYFFRKAQSLVPREYPDVFNQAMMEFGAIQCVPKNPKCEECIFKRSCVAFANDWQDRLPLKSKKAKVKRRYFYYFVIRKNKKWALQLRRGKDIWHGLFDFYLLEAKRPQNPKTLAGKDEVLKGFRSQMHSGKTSALYKHVLSHQTLFTRFIQLDATFANGRNAGFHAKGLKFYSTKEIQKLPKPILINRYLQETLFL
jgi:A/G-specific adenine glycosylase